MSIPNISVIMGVYNGAEYLKDAVDSILNQTYTDFEFIIINDGSTDETTKILNTYTDNRIIIINQENLGLTLTLNKAIKLSKAKFIARQDADDYSMPDRFIKQINYLKEHRDVSIVGSWYETIDIFGDRFLEFGVKNNDNAIRNVLLKGLTPFAHGSVIMRKNDIGKVGFYDERFMFSQDYNLWLRALMGDLQIAVIEESLYSLRYYPATNRVKYLCQKAYTDSSLKYYSTKKYEEDPENIINNANNNVGSEFQQKKWANKNKNKYYLILGINAIKMNNRLKALKCLSKALSIANFSKSILAISTIILPNKIGKLLLGLPSLYKSFNYKNTTNEIKNNIKYFKEGLFINENDKVYSHGNDTYTIKDFNSYKNKICFISYYSYGLFNNLNNVPFGGAEVQISLLGRSIAKDQKIKINYLVGDFNQGSLEEFDQISIHKIYKKSNYKLPLFKGLQFSLNLIKKIYQLGNDIYIQRAAGYQTGVIALACKIFGKKFIFMTASETDCNREFINSNKKIVGLLYLIGLKLADLVITQSNEHQRFLLENHGINAQILKSSYYLTEYNNEGKNIILYVATRLEPNKKPELFLKLANEIPTMKFVLIGKPIESHIEYSNKIIQESKLIDNLEYIPELRLMDIDKYYRRAKVFVSTSDFEGFPASFVQAMANSTPVLSLSVNPDDFLTKYGCGYYAKGDFIRLKKFLVKISNNPEELSKMSHKAYKYAKDNHDLEANTKIFIGLIKDICVE